jgi:hypothetical protein
VSRRSVIVTGEPLPSPVDTRGHPSAPLKLRPWLNARQALTPAYRNHAPAVASVGGTPGSIVGDVNAAATRRRRLGTEGLPAATRDTILALLADEARASGPSKAQPAGAKKDRWPRCFDVEGAVFGGM